MKKKRLLAAALIGILAVGTLTGCKSADKGNTTSKTDSGATTEESKVIKVAASATPHAQILEQATPILAEAGWHRQVT